MKIKELRWRGLLIWPPQWTEECPDAIRKGLLKDVKILPLTELIRIDATFLQTIISGLIFTSDDYQISLFNKLKENIGKTLDELGNMELNY